MSKILRLSEWIKGRKNKTETTPAKYAKGEEKPEPVQEPEYYSAIHIQLKNNRTLNLELKVAKPDGKFGVREAWLDFIKWYHCRESSEVYTFKYRDDTCWTYRCIKKSNIEEYTITSKEIKHSKSASLFPK